MRKYIVLNLSANMISFFINMGISFYLTPYIIRNIGSEAYAFYSFSSQITNYIAIITVALNSMLIRYISINFHRNKVEEANVYFSSSIIGNVVLSLLIGIISLFLIFNIEKYLNVPLDLTKDVKTLFVFVLISFLSSTIFNAHNVGTFIKNKLYLRSIRDVQANLIKVIVLVILFTLFKPTITYQGVSVFIASIFLTSFNVYYTKKLTPELKFSIGYFNVRYLMILIKSGIWNSLNKLSSILFDGVDLLLANIYLNTVDMSYLAVAKTIPIMLKSLIFNIVTSFVPTLNELYAKNKKEELITEVQFSIKIMSFLVNVPLVGLIVFGKHFFKLWIGDGNEAIYHSLSIISILPMLITSLMQPLSNINTITNKIKVPVLVSILTGILSVSLTVISLTFFDFGIYSIVIISSFFLTIKELCFTPIYVSKILEIKFRIIYTIVIKSLISMFVIGISFVLINNLFSIHSWGIFVTICAISGLLGYAMSAFIIFNKDEINRFYDSIKNKFIH